MIQLVCDLEVQYTEQRDESTAQNQNSPPLPAASHSPSKSPPAQRPPFKHPQVLPPPPITVTDDSPPQLGTPIRIPNILNPPTEPRRRNTAYTAST